MPEYAGQIKYPKPDDDKYSTAYGEPQWWRDLAVTANAAAATPHGLIENTLAKVTLDTAGGVQHQVGGQRVWWHDHQGVLRQGEVPFSRITGAPAPVTGAALKVAPLALTTGRSVSVHNTSRSVRVPLRFNAPVGRWRLHVRNWNPRLGAVTAAAVNFTGLWLADTPGSGAISGTPERLRTAWATPANGDEWTSAWFDADIGGDVERLLCFGYTTSTAPPALTGGSYQNADPAQAISGTAHTRASLTPFDLWIEAETPGTTPIYAGVGDSLTSGTGANLPVHESWVSQYARRVGGLPMHVSHHGDSMNGFLTVNPGKVSRWDHLTRADAVVWALGSNDIADGRTLAQMQADYATLLPIIEAAVGPVAYAATVQPRDGWDATVEASRTAWNTWLTSRPNVRGVLDFASVVSADGDTILPQYVASDGTHLNTAGYLAEADSITTPLATASPSWDSAIAALNAAAA